MAWDEKNQLTAIIIGNQKKPIMFGAKKIAIINLTQDGRNQRNLALKQASTRWVLFLKEEEVLPRSLIKEIKNFTDKADLQGWTGAQLIVKNLFLEKTLGYGNWSPQKEVRLGRRVGEWIEKDDQLLWQFPGQKTILSSPITAKPYDNLKQLLTDINLKSTNSAKRKYQRFRRTTILGVIFLPLIFFLKTFFLKLGFLDRLAGFVLAVLEGFRVFLEESKLLLLIQEEKNKKTKVDN